MSNRNLQSSVEDAVVGRLQAVVRSRGWLGTAWSKYPLLGDGFAKRVNGRVHLPLSEAVHR